MNDMPPIVEEEADIDVEVCNHGTIVSVQAWTNAAPDWIDANVMLEDYQRKEWQDQGSLAVEPHYLAICLRAWLPPALRSLASRLIGS
jgi:hypothetical protein